MTPFLARSVLMAATALLASVVAGIFVGAVPVDPGLQSGGVLVRGATAARRGAQAM